jgi:hypothetical protein
MNAEIEAPEAHEPAPGQRRGRSVASWAVLVIAGVLLLLSSFAVWIDRVALNTDVFVDTSAELIEDDKIRRAVAQRAVDELYASVDVEAAIQERLPNDVESLAGPSAAALRQVAPEILDRALEQQALQRLWRATLRQTHEELVDVLEGGGRTVSTEGGVVALDLRELVLEAADRIGIRAQVEGRLSEDAGRIEVLRSNELDTAQDAFQLLNTIAWLLPLLTLAAFGLAVWLAAERRRAVRGVGVTLVVVGGLGLVAARLTGNYVVNSLVAERDTREAADNAWDILTDLMRSSFRWMIVGGILFVVAAWLAGPGRRALATRGVLAPAIRNRTWAYASLALVAVILLVIGSVGDFTRFLLVAVLVALGAAWIELMRAQTTHEFPDATTPAFFADTRTRVSGWLEELRAAGPASDRTAAPATDMTARLLSLADLHTRGELTDEEYAAAKARVLSGE